MRSTAAPAGLDATAAKGRLFLLSPADCFPPDFVGRGDRSRGGLLLRCVRERRELGYVPILGAEGHGVRPPRLAPAARSR